MIFVVLGIQLILNITTTHRIKSEIQTNKTSLVEQKETNRRLKIKRNNLKDPDYLAKYIRYKFYYSKKGEQIYNIRWGGACTVYFLMWVGFCLSMLFPELERIINEI